CCSDNNGGCGKNALCSEDPTTSAVKCTCKTGFTNTGCDEKVVCKDSCTIKNGGCGSHAVCSHHAKTNAVICTSHIPANANWAPNGVTVAGGNGCGNAANQLFWPGGLFVDNNQTVVTADFANHRIMQWRKCDATNGQVVAGGNGKGNGLNQLNHPTDVLFDKKTNSLIICDWGNHRIVRWSRRRDTAQGEVLIDNIYCWGLAMDERRNLYVTDWEKQQVSRHRFGEQTGTVVAGGHGKCSGLNQFSNPTYLFVDRHHSVYVSDKENHRVMKWTKGATEGIVVAGGKCGGCALSQLNCPQGLLVDAWGTVYVADSGNHRVMRWTQKDKTQGTVVVGGKGAGTLANQLNVPFGLSFDQHDNLYVVDNNNHRLQRFSLEKHC
ncbi:unnamed protein product, partial [Rotaria magnacalcarata]